MKQTKKYSKSLRLLSAVLALVMVLSLLPLTVFAEERTQSGTTAASENAKDFLRIFHLDCGRKYFSVSEIKGIIDQLAANYFTHIQLAFGNDGLRFLLDDMSLTVNGTTYTSEKVSNAIKSGNSTYSDSNGTASTMLSETDMDDIIAYAKEKGIEVIPMFNTPYHMDALLNAMVSLGISDAKTTLNNVSRYLNLESSNAVAFVKALQQKYMDYFKSKGCEYYNIATDEYAFDNISDTVYTEFAEYVNDLAEMVKNTGMQPMAFNDGFYWTSRKSNVAFDTDIMICYWSNGGNRASAETLIGKGFKIINNNDSWYYVLGDALSSWANPQWRYKDAAAAIPTVPVTQIKGYSGSTLPVGSVLCCWCDYPSKSYPYTSSDNKTGVNDVYSLIALMASSNPDYFKAAPEVAIKCDKDKVYPGDVVNLTLSGDATATSWKVDSDTVLTIEPAENGATAKATALTAGTATVTAVVDGKEYSLQITVTAHKINAASTTLTINGSVELTTNSGRSATWTTSNPNVISLIPAQNDEAGNVIGSSVVASAVGLGTATITATIDGVEYTITLSVTDKVYHTEEVALTVGKSKTITISGVNYANDSSIEYVAPDGSIAKAEISGQDAGTQYVYTQNSVTYATLTSGMSNSNSYQKTNYFYKSGNDYYPVYARRSSSKYYYGYSVTDSANNVTAVADTKKGNDAISLYSRSSQTLEASTTIKLTGVAAGTTSLIIGDYQYKITVVSEDLTNAATLPIQLWITNVSIEVTGVTTKGSGQFNDYNNGGYAYYVSAKAEDAYGQQGVLLSAIVPEAVIKNDNNTTETTIDDRDATYTIWKGTVLNTTTGLQKYWWNDMTKAEGRVDYQYVRYYGGEWAVSNDRVNWTTVTGEGSTGAASGCKEQVIAYYMQRTDVTTEVITDVVDWGNTTDKWASDKPTQYGVLDFAVQYPDGTRIPGKKTVNGNEVDDFPQTGKTVYFHCDESDKTGVVFKDDDDNYYRRIGLIKATDTTGYEVYMITITPTSDVPTDQLTNSSTALTTNTLIDYKGTEKVAWVDDEANLPTKFNSADAKFHSISGTFNYTAGGNANLAGLEIYQRQGMLVTYYLRPRTTIDSLHVHYIDKVAEKEFHSYAINVKNVEGQESTLFDPNIGLDDPWKGKLKNGTVYNDQGILQTVSADLSTMPQISAQYRFGKYTCVEVMRSNDGKDVYLYYTFDYNATFVVDFGLPIIITPQSVSNELAAANITGVNVVNKSYYADITTDNNYNVIYSLNSTIDGEDNFQVVYSGENLSTEEAGTATFTLRIIPAANVYYEDSFASFTHGSGSAANAKWSIDGTETSETQALEELGKKTNVYGYDSAYATSTQFSMGSAHKVTVTSDMASSWTEGSAWPTATFTFKGTGFDVISLTDNTSGAIFVDVVNTATGNTEKSYMVDNYYGYTQDADGNWVVNKDAKNTLYQIPVMKVTGLAYAEYTVTIRAAYSSFFDHTGDSQYNFWLDAIRVYDPMGTGYADYTNDQEGYPQYIKLRDQIAKNDGSVQANVLFIDGGNTAEITTYANYGPNNEVYLAHGQAITFNVTGENIATIQIGAKAPNGGAAMSVNDTTTDIGSATEMYYEISKAAGSFMITNTGDGILSLTNLKITFSAENSTAALSPLTTEQQNDAVMAVRALFTVAPVVFEPSRFEASWNRSSVRAGQKATLTVKASEDVDAITVNGQTITTFRVRTERTGWGWWATRVTYREFTYSVNPTETADYEVAAVNADGVSSEALTLRLTVSGRGFGGWLRDIFGF